VEAEVFHSYSRFFCSFLNAPIYRPMNRRFTKLMFLTEPLSAESIIKTVSKKMRLESFSKDHVFKLVIPSTKECPHFIDWLSYQGHRFL
jgi:hypothetical protein